MDRSGFSGIRLVVGLFWKEKEDIVKGFIFCDRKGMICVKIVFSFFVIFVCKRREVA